MGDSHKCLAVVIPVYRSEQSLPRVVAEVLTTLDTVIKELILVIDGSPDDSAIICRELASQEKRVKFISLRKNFGEHNAVLCGLNFVTAQYVAIMDDDAQHPPAEILKMLSEIQKGYDIVFGAYQKKEHHWFRNLGSFFANSVATLFINKPKDLYLSSFKIIRAEVLADVINYRGPFPYLDGLLLRVTNNFSTCYVEHRKRELGTSNYTLRKLVRLWLNMFLNFSALPLRVILLLGVLCFSLGLCFSLIAVLEWFFSSKVPQGYTSVFISVLLLSGVQLVSLGVIGEYLGKLFLHYNGTPQWIIKESSFGESRAIHTKPDAGSRVSIDGTG